MDDCTNTELLHKVNTLLRSGVFIVRCGTVQEAPEIKPRPCRRRIQPVAVEVTDEALDRGVDLPGVTRATASSYVMPATAPSRAYRRLRLPCGRLVVKGKWIVREPDCPIRAYSACTFAQLFELNNPKEQPDHVRPHPVNC